jgi:putative transposase
MLLTPPDKDACSSLMHGLGRRYVRYFNDRHGRTGTLWEGRFRCCLVESAEYVLSCYRYIELNPVRAGMAPSARHYPWSSFHANCGLAEEPMLSEHAEYGALAPDIGRRREVYRVFCEVEEAPRFLSAIREATNKGFPLVGESLKAKLRLSGYRTESGKPGPRPGTHEASAAQGSLQLAEL